MQAAFGEWLSRRGLDKKTVATQLSQAARLVRHFGDLDKAFDLDRFERIRSTLEYSKEDQRGGRVNPAPFPIEGDLYSNLASYRTTLNYYRAFREGDRSALAAEESKNRTAAGDEPLIDLNEAALKRLVARVKKRGYISYAELNGALPQEQMSAEQIKDVIDTLSEMGVVVVEDVDEPTERAPALDRDALEEMRSAFLQHFPDFEEKGFEAEAGGYWQEERRYKQALIDAAATVVEQTDLGLEDLGAQFLGILGSKGSNLLDWRELRRIEEVRREAPGLIERAIGEMVRTPAPPSEAAARFIADVGEAYCMGQEGNMPFAHLRAIPTTVLALAKPDDAIAVRYGLMHAAVTRLLHRSPFANAPMTQQEYLDVLIMARLIARAMQNEWHWQPRDLWDVQGFLWVAIIASGHQPTDPPLDPTGEPAPEQHNDYYHTLRDNPTLFDELERAPFAAVLAERIIAIGAAQASDGTDEDKAFMVHIQGPWGSGKSTMLHLLQKELEHRVSAEPPPLVVWFNAWKHQRMRPPWWAFLSTLYGAAVRHAPIGGAQNPSVRRLALRWLWWKWRLRADFLPVLLVALVLGCLAYALVAGASTGSLETLLKIIVPIMTVAATLATYARLVAFGSAKAADTYANLATDPFGPVIKLFNDLVRVVRRPVVIFIDDLDRCDGDYVVELLEGIQTLFRGANVTYVVGADRKWICRSFETRYLEFSNAVGEPCRPLGYLFLDKMFQASIGMPHLTPELKARYFAALLAGSDRRSTNPGLTLSEAAAARVRGLTDEEEIQNVIRESAGGTLDEQRAIRAAAALQITRPAAAAATEHRLQKLADVLESNPRSMKRLVNAVGLDQARGMLDGRAVKAEARARWTMLSQRWPIFAEFVAENPDAIRHWQKSAAKSRGTAAKPDPSWPQAIRDLIGNPVIIGIVGGPDEEGALTAENLPLLVA